jgi:hypothetical protein
MFAGRNGQRGREMKPLIFAAANGSDLRHGVGDKTPDIRQSPMFAGRNGQRGREMKPLIFAAANRSDPCQWAGDETPDIRLSPDDLPH